MTPNTMFAIPYGSDRLSLRPPAGSVQLQVNEPQKVITPALFQQRLDDFLQQTPLDLACPILVVADKTRLCGYPEYLPLLISGLERHGMDSARLKIIIAYGTHPRQSDEECLQAFGEVYGRYTFIHHDCKEPDTFADLGRTSRGTPIRHRRDLLAASAVITMGPACHHYFAGYGGGRKLIFPGCGEREAVYANHGLYLDRSAGILAPGCQPGIINGNPLAEDLFEIEEKLPADLALHGILDSHGTLCNLLVGRGKEIYRKACAVHGEACEITSSRFDTVIGSCGGYPKDINFIQSHKAIHNAAMFVKDGGLLLLYAECRDGIGSQTFLPWFEVGGFAEAFRKLAGHYEGNGGTALAMMTKLQRIRIGLITSLDDSICGLIGVERWHHDRVSQYLAEQKAQNSVALIPNASMVVLKA